MLIFTVLSKDVNNTCENYCQYQYCIPTTLVL